VLVFSVSFKTQALKKKKKSLKRCSKQFQNRLK